MKAGILGVVGEEFSHLQPYSDQRTEDGTELTDQIDITRIAQTPEGIDINEGVAAREVLSERESVTIEYDSIEVQDEPDIVTRHTRFAVVPGDLLVVQNTSGLFLFEILNQAVDISPERVQIDLDGVLSEFESPALWKVGFYDRDGGAENGVLHGEDLQDDPAFADHLTTGAKNQLGMRVEDDGTEFNINITESGYVEVYEPRELDTDGYLKFIRENIQPHFVEGR